MNTLNKPQQIPEFVKNYLDNRCEDSEKEAAESWLCDNINNSEFDAEFENILDSLAPSDDKDSLKRSRSALVRFMEIESEITRKNRQTKRAFFWFASAVAAAVAVFVSLFFHKAELFEFGAGACKFVCRVLLFLKFFEPGLQALQYAGELFHLIQDMPKGGELVALLVETRFKLDKLGFKFKPQTTHFGFKGSFFLFNVPKDTLGMFGIKA